MNACLRQAILVYPSKMLYPSIVPLGSVLDAFHNKRSASQYECNKKRLRMFYFAFLAFVLHHVTVSQFLTCSYEVGSSFGSSFPSGSSRCSRASQYFVSRTPRHIISRVYLVDPTVTKDWDCYPCVSTGNTSQPLGTRLQSR
jgi:hypothetical protein